MLPEVAALMSASAGLAGAAPDVGGKVLEPGACAGGAACGTAGRQAGKQAQNVVAGLSVQARPVTCHQQCHSSPSSSDSVFARLRPPKFSGLGPGGTPLPATCFMR